MNEKHNQSLSNFYFVILLLVTLDQLIKVIINNHFMAIDVYFIKNMFGFRPYLNTENLSFLNRVLHLNIRTSTLLIINTSLLIILFGLYIERAKASSFTKLEKWSFIFLIAGSFSSVLDKVIYHGSLDYILFFNWIVDLKDIYITVAEVLIPIVLVRNFIKLLQTRKNIMVDKVKSE